MATVRIGLFSYPGVIENCVLNRSKLTADKHCPNLGIGADLLGRALDIANVSYKLVPFFNLNPESYGFGSYDPDTGTWHGE